MSPATAREVLKLMRRCAERSIADDDADDNVTRDAWCRLLGNLQERARSYDDEFDDLMPVAIEAKARALDAEIQALEASERSAFDV